MRTVFEGDTVQSFTRFDGPIPKGVVILEAEMESGEKLCEELPIPSASPSADSEEISTIARLVALARLKECKGDIILQTALNYRLLTQWTNWIAVVERPEGEKALEIPALRKTAQMPAAMGIEPLACMKMFADQSRSIPRAHRLARSIADSEFLSDLRSRMPASDSRDIPMTRQSNMELVQALLTLSISNLSNIIEFLALITESEWTHLADWASAEGHSGIVFDANVFMQLLRTRGVSNLNKEQARKGLIVLRRAASRGLNVRKELVDEALRRGTLAFSPIG
jgi:hypothetical protein